MSVETDRQRLGGAIARLRTESGMSQVELATRMRNAGYQWAQATVWNAEKGERKLCVFEVATLANLFGVTLDVMIGADGAPKVDRRAGLQHAMDLIARELKEG